MVARAEWADLVAAFDRFFSRYGTVTANAASVEFIADPSLVSTGLQLAIDGSSRSFMPLHEMTARWEEVVFDDAGLTVTLVGKEATYLYRVPPILAG